MLFYLFHEVNCCGRSWMTSPVDYHWISSDEVESFVEGSLYEQTTTKVDYRHKYCGTLIILKFMKYSPN